MSTNYCFMGLRVCCNLSRYTVSLSNLLTDYGTLKNVDLNGPLHPLFNRARWEVTNDEYRLLLPSMRLASNLIEIGMPWISNFLPSDKLWPKPVDSDKDIWDQPAVIPVNPRPSEKDIKAAREELSKIAGSVRWQINYQMWRQSRFDHVDMPFQWMGITRLVDTPRPWEVTTYEDIVAADIASHDKGLDRRPLIVGIMGEYVKTLRRVYPGSEEHHRATFMAAITMTHEIGHVVYHSDFRALNPNLLREPYVGNDCSSELGFSFTCSIFGWHPQARVGEWGTIELLHWEPKYTMDMKGRPLYKELYAMSMKYPDDLLSQAFWDDLGDPRNMKSIEEFEATQLELSPAYDIEEHRVPIKRVPDWSYSFVIREPEWNDRTFRLKGFRKGDDVKGLTHEEIEHARDTTGNAGNTPLEALSDEAIAYRKRIVRLIHHGDLGEDDDPEEFASDLVPDDSPELTGIPQIDVDDGVIEEDVDTPIKIPGYTAAQDDEVTRIEVTYLAGASTSPAVNFNKRVRFDDGKTSGERKKPKTGKSSCSKSDYTDVEDFLEQVTPYQIAKWSRIQAHQYCIKNNLRSFPEIKQDVYWQSTRLDLTKDAEMAIAVRICDFKYQQASQLPIFAGDDDALAVISESSLKYVPHMTLFDLQAQCAALGLQSNGNHTVLVRRVIDGRRAAMPADPPKDYVRKPQQPEDRTHTGLIELLHSYDLPTWGTKNALIERARRNQSDEQRLAAGEPRVSINTRPSQPHRTDKQGFEHYSFLAKLTHSTVTALKSALSIAGDFRPDAVLTLFFYPNASDILEDGKKLSEYQHRDWTNLRLKVGAKWRFGPGSLSAHPIDLTKPGHPTLYWGKYITPPPAPVVVLNRVDARAKEIREGAPLTVLEKFERIRTRVPALDRLVTYKDFQGKRKTRHTIDILGEVEDLEELEEGRDGRVGKEGEGKPFGLVDTKIPLAKKRKRNPLSHMAAIYDHVEHFRF